LDKNKNCYYFVKTKKHYERLNGRRRQNDE
jgi:hypothetical protein